MNRIKIIFAFTFLTISAIAQDFDTALKFSGSIDVQELNKLLTVFASDKFEGRETGKKGQKLAAEFLSKKFKEVGLADISPEGSFQTFKLIEKVLSTRNFEVNQVQFPIADHFFPITESNLVDIQSNDIIFVGYGINEGKYNSFKDINVEGKVVVALQGEPFYKNKYLLSGKKDVKSKWSNNNQKIAEIKKLKPSMIIIINKDFKQYSKYYKHSIEKSKISLGYKKSDDDTNADIPVVYCSEKVAYELLSPNKLDLNDEITYLNKSKKGYSPIKLKSTLKLNIEYIIQDISSENVLGYIEGSDLKDEYIFITAHYDHIGIIDGLIYNGADDDGSGTVALIEIAQAFNEAKNAGYTPRRSIVFMAVSGEEKGLLGSEFYSDHPIVPLEQTVANLNIDMIGRIDEAHKKDTNYIYIIGSDKLSTELHTINEQANSHINLKLDYKYNDPKDPNMFYYRSDHYNFAKHNIPIIFYFNGVHEDYHKDTDEVSKIHFPMLAKRAQLVFLTAWGLANREKRIVVDKTNDFPVEK